MRLHWILALAFVALVPLSAAAQTSPRVYLNSAIGQRHRLPFSSGVRVGNTLYIAGTTGVDPDTKGSVSPQQEARLVMDDVKSTVERSGMTMDDLVWVQVFCTNLAEYDTFNSVYRTYFHANYPARTFIGVAHLLFGARFEINAIAIAPAH